MRIKRNDQILGYGGCEVMQDDIAGPDGQPMRANFMRIITLQAAKGGKTSQGVGPWIYITTEALEELAKDLAQMVVAMKSVQAGADPDQLPSSETLTVTRLPDGPVN